MLSIGEVDAKVRRLFTSNRAWLPYLMFGGAYSALFALGVYTDDSSVLALAWPANAFMLGMLVRFPLLARPLGWIACLAGFAIAVAIIGYGLGETASLAAYNFGIVAIGYGLLSNFSRVDQRLERPISVFYMLAAVVPASLYAGLVGSILKGPVFSTPETVNAFRYWFSVELLNELAFLPMILTLPREGQWARQLPLTLHDQAPIVVLVLSAVFGALFGGLAALAFPVPALLLCAISYRVFLTALLTFAYCAWTVIATTLGYVDLSNIDQSLVLSIAIGRALITLGPLIISTTTATRNEVLDQLRYLAAEREIVSNELEHRIKNLFALVNGLIGLSIRDNPDLRPLADTLKNRLVALQHAHGLIRTMNTSNNAAGELTSLKELIGVLLRPYEGGSEKQLVIDGDDALVDSGTVTLLALVFHELATNSAKYGALSDPQGTLEVHIKHRVDAVHIRWIEKVSLATGQPAFADSGFGSKLLDLTIKSQLQGSYARSQTMGGVSIEIILPSKLFNRIAGR
ncbi:two-component sensor histidine kinase [Mesorhizobium soli]|uniref:sensor histidine kinase n=1 Tax=Pseudaminobacter soli (ex Li et al. 2025) TaxID=1295366 RepID=UPI002474B2DE|nr:HWE histidine kinase domain-containing protein [Mesorhizobium soli]MDH6232350.1 two-component sensor histidine kinase [Mesorhizobium soli]